MHASVIIRIQRVSRLGEVVQRTSRDDAYIFQLEHLTELGLNVIRVRMILPRIRLVMNLSENKLQHLFGIEDSMLDEARAIQSNTSSTIVLFTSSGIIDRQIPITTPSVVMVVSMCSTLRTSSS